MSLKYFDSEQNKKNKNDVLETFTALGTQVLLNLFNNDPHDDIVRQGHNCFHVFLY